MSEADSELRRLLDNPAFPRSRGYEPRWVLDNLMGPNVLWLAEALSHVLVLQSGMRVLDLGCGRALSSIFLAREFGVQVWAADLWIKPTESWHRVVEAGVADRVFPVHAEAHQLPFAAGFFDAIVSLDAYHYFGTDDWYIGYITRFLAPGGRLGIVVPGLAGPWEAASDALKAHWIWEYATFHGPSWWRERWQSSGLVEVEHAELVPDGWRHWVQSDRASGSDRRDSAWVAALEADAGRTLGFTRVVAKVLPVDVGPHPSLP
jgi:SAM-dependent methyltransferase